MTGWRGLLLAFLIGVAMAVGLQPMPLRVPCPAPSPSFSDLQLPTLGVDK